MQIPDDIIRRLMLEAGHCPGEQIRDETIRRYSEALAEWVRRQDHTSESH